MPTYLDHAATSPIRPSVLSAYSKALELIGNPASVHSFGQSSRMLLEEAREEIALNLDCDRSEVIFTSGGTESDNLAVKGIYWQRKSVDPNRRLVITSASEHHAVLEAVDWLVKEQGAEAIFVPLNALGEIDLGFLEDLLTKRAGEVALISIMWANNEIGVINPIKQVTEIAKKFSIPVHSDAIAAFGHTPISFSQSGLSALTITGHKVGSPVGIGALLLARDQKLSPLFQGGSHERGLRSGTPDAAAAKAFAISVAEAVAEREEKSVLHQKLIEQIIARVREVCKTVQVTGEGAAKLPNVVHFRFQDVLGETLMFLLDQEGIAVSTGAACTAGVAEPSHVILALGGSEADALACIRVSLGHSSMASDVDAFLEAFPAAYLAATKAHLVGKK